MTTLWFFVVWVLVGLLVTFVTSIYWCARIGYENNWGDEYLNYMTGFINEFNRFKSEESDLFTRLGYGIITLIGWPFKVYWIKTTLIPIAVESYRDYLRSKVG